MALLLTISLTAVLVAVTLEMNRQVRATVVASVLKRDRLTMTYMAETGIQAAMGLLIADKTGANVDSLQEPWADAELISTLLSEMPFETGEMRVEIMDELSKIQINALVEYPNGHNFNESQRSVWERFVTAAVTLLPEGEDVAPIDIINSIKDWLDSSDDDAVTGLNGAESDYYRGLDPPYECSNGPFTSLGELLQVKGITPHLFQSADQSLGIGNFITVYGMRKLGPRKFSYEGKVNINTAGLPVLKALMPVEYQDLAQSIIDYRQEYTDGQYLHDLSSPNWYKKAPGCGDLELDPSLITIASDLFRIQAAVTLDQKTGMTITTVVQRERDKKGRWHCRVLSWEYR